MTLTNALRAQASDRLYGDPALVEVVLGQFFVVRSRCDGCFCRLMVTKFRANYCLGSLVFEIGRSLPTAGHNCRMKDIGIGERLLFSNPEAL